VRTGRFGFGAFRFVFHEDLPPGYFLTSTATDIAGNTSEFSPCAEFLGPRIGH